MRLAIFAFVLALLCKEAIAATPLNEFERFRSYPFLDKAYKAAGKEEWKEVERLMRHLLEKVPAHLEARQLLVQALAAQLRFDEALQEAGALGNESAEHLLELRLALVERRLTPANGIEDWLRQSKGDARERLWKTYSLALADMKGAQAAWQWLASLPWAGDAALRRWRSTFAEQAGQWSWVIADLKTLTSQLPVASEDWLRLGLAYIQLNDNEALHELLAHVAEHPHAKKLRRVAIERGIARKDAESALRWLQTLGPPENLSLSDQSMMWELALQTKDIELVRRLAPHVGHPCLETAQWLIQYAADEALAQLMQCAPKEDPRRWLELVRRLQAIDMLMATNLPARWEQARGNLLLQLLQAQGREKEALAWVLRQPENTFLRPRAELLQAAGLRTEAALAWQRLYKLTGLADALEQASYLFSETGDYDAAVQLLNQALAQGGLSVAAWERLAALLTRAQAPLDITRLTALLAQAPEGTTRGPLLVKLAQEQICEPVQSHASPKRDGALAWRALAHCMASKQPGAAVVYYRQALALGDIDSERALAFTLDAAGDPVGASEIWSKQATANLAPAERLAAARSALAAGKGDVAEEYWQSLGAFDGEGWRLGAAIALTRGEPELALEREKSGLIAADSLPEHFYAAAATALSSGDKAQSLLWLREAKRRAPEQSRYGADYGLRLAASEKRADRLPAIPYLHQAEHNYPADYRFPEALGLRLAETGNNEPARAALRRAVDLLHPPLGVNGEDGKALLERKYALRRTHEALTRRSTLTLAGSWAPVGGAPGNAQRMNGSSLQLGMWDYALGKEPVRDGRVLAVYGRVFASGQQREAFLDSLGIGLGLRYKPFTSVNLNLYAELYGQSARGRNENSELMNSVLEGSSRDFLLRTTASFLDKDEYRSDWRPTETVWKERQLYLDAAWFVRSNQRQFLARYHQGVVFKLAVPGAHTLSPYGMVQVADQDGLQDLRVGLGIRWQWWFDNDRYNAYRDRLSFKLEYQKALNGSLYQRASGWLLGVELSL